MLPCIDLCNHSFAPNCTLESQRDNSVCLIAREDIPADEPLTITYGFIMQDNLHDSVEMRLSVDYIQVSSFLPLGRQLSPAAFPGTGTRNSDGLCMFC